MVTQKTENNLEHMVIGQEPRAGKAHTNEGLQPGILYIW